MVAISKDCMDFQKIVIYNLYVNLYLRKFSYIIWQ